MASVESLGYRIKSIKKVQTGTMWTKLSCGNLMASLKNNSTIPILLSFNKNPARNEDTYHYEWSVHTSAEDDVLVLLPGQELGPLFIEDLFFKATHSTSHLQIIERELR